MSQKNLIIAIAICAFLISGCTTKKQINTAVSYESIKTASTTLSRSDQKRDNMFNLSGESLKEAIKSGEIDNRNFKLFEKTFELPIIENKSDTQEIQVKENYRAPSVTLETPYYIIAEKSNEKFQKFDKLSDSDAKNSYDFKSQLLLNIIFHKSKFGHNFVLEQDGKYIQPSNSSGDKDSAFILFPYKDIDFSKELHFIFLDPNKEKYISYKIDFDKYK